MNVEAWRKNENTSSFDRLVKGVLLTVEGYFKPEGRFFVLILLVILIILHHFNTLLKRCKIIKNELIKLKVFRFIVLFAQKKG